jgi:hypothetical protein
MCKGKGISEILVGKIQATAMLAVPLLKPGTPLEAAAQQRLGHIARSKLLEFRKKASW